MNLPTVPDAAPALPGWRDLLNALGEPAWLVEPLSLQVLAVNTEALALLGLAAVAVLGQPADGLIATPEDLAWWDEARAAAGLPARPASGPAPVGWSGIL